MGNYIVFKGIYDTANLFTDEIVAALSEEGHTARILHLDTLPEDLTEMMRFVKEDSGVIDGVLMFNNIGFNMGEDAGGNLWESLHTTYHDIIMDHPFHYADKLRHLPENSVVYCIDKNHISYIRRFLPEVKRATFLPHAGCFYTLDALSKTGGLPAPEEERDIDVLYAGNLSRVILEQLIPDFSRFTKIDAVAFSEAVLTSLIQNPARLTEDVIEEELRKLPPYSGEDALSDEELEWYITEFRFLDGFAVSYFRELAVRVLVENGIRVHVLGEGWETCDWADNDNLILLGKVGAPDVLSYMARSKIVLNTLTWFKDGAHDRIFNGMLAGALVVSDESDYLRETFRNHKEIELFALPQIFSLPRSISSYLEDDNKRLRVAKAGQEAANRSHIWMNRLKEGHII